MFRCAEKFLAELAHDIAPKIEILHRAPGRQAGRLELACRDRVIESPGGGNMAGITPVQEELCCGLLAVAAQQERRHRGNDRAGAQVERITKEGAKGQILLEGLFCSGILVWMLLEDFCDFMPDGFGDIDFVEIGGRPESHLSRLFGPGEIEKPVAWPVLE